jgi:hypothetical protein
VPLLLCSYERLEGPTLYLSPYFERHRTRNTQTCCSGSVKPVTLVPGCGFSSRPSTLQPRNRSSARNRSCNCARTTDNACKGFALAPHCSRWWMGYSNVHP